MIFYQIQYFHLWDKLYFSGTIEYSMVPVPKNFYHRKVWSLSFLTHFQTYPYHLYSLKYLHLKFKNTFSSNLSSWFSYEHFDFEGDYPDPNCRQIIIANPATKEGIILLYAVFCNIKLPWWCLDYHVGYSQAFFDPYSLDHFDTGISVPVKFRPPWCCQIENWRLY